MKTEKIKAKYYITANRFNEEKKFAFYIKLNKSKPAISSICTERLYTDEIIAITVEESDKEKINRTFNRVTGGMTVADIMLAIFGKDRNKKFAYITDPNEFVYAIPKPKFYTPGYYGKLGSTEFTFYVAEISNIKPLPISKKEEEQIKVIKEKEARCKMNAATISNTLLNILNENGYDVGNTDNKGVYYKSVKGYNKLMKDALEYYLNDKIFKDMNIKITTPKVNDKHKYGYNDNLFHFGDVEIKQ